MYRKPTHTNLYLQWDSHHTIAAKYSVVNTLHHRARAVCSNPQLLKKEEEHLHMVLIENKYPAWTLNRVKMKISAPYNLDQNKGGPASVPMLHTTVRGPIGCAICQRAK